MKKLFFCGKIAILFLAFAVLQISCKDEINNASPLPEIKGAKIENNTMVFASEDAFKEFRTSIEKKTDKELLSISQQNGIKSHFQDIENLRKVMAQKSAKVSQEIVTKYEQRVLDHYFASMLNNDRELQIGKKRYRTNNDYVFVYMKGQEGKIDAFYDALKMGKVVIPDDKNAHPFEDIQVAKVYHEKYTLQEANKLNKSKSARVSSDNCQSYSPDGSQRVNGSVWTSWYLIYNSGGITTEVEHYTGSWIFGWFPGWYDYNADRVWVNGHNMRLPLRFAGQVICCNDFCDDVFREYTNDDEVSPVIKWQIPFPTTYFSWYTAEVRSGASLDASHSYWCEFVCFNP